MSGLSLEVFLFIPSFLYGVVAVREYGWEMSWLIPAKVSACPLRWLQFKFSFAISSRLGGME